MEVVGIMGPFLMPFSVNGISLGSFFTARPEGKVNSDEKNRNNNKRAGKKKRKKESRDQRSSQGQNRR